MTINPMEMPGKGPIPVFNQQARVIEWWSLSPEGRRVGNPRTGLSRLLDGGLGNPSPAELASLLCQGWVRYALVNGYDHDYQGLTEKDIIDLVKFVTGSIGSGKRDLIFAVIREWRLYKKWYGETLQKLQETEVCGTGKTPTPADGPTPMTAKEAGALHPPDTAKAPVIPKATPVPPMP